MFFTASYDLNAGDSNILSLVFSYVVPLSMNCRLYGFAIRVNAFMGANKLNSKEVLNVKVYDAASNYSLFSENIVGWNQ